MTDITEKQLVRCPLSQADRMLSRFFKSIGNSDGSVARLELQADIPIATTQLHLERPVIATILAHQNPGEMIPSYAVSWAPEGGGPYPLFSGQLRFGAMDDYNSFELVLDGRYEPPLGIVGAGFDRVLGHRVALSMAKHLVTTIGARIEAMHTSEEAAKIHAS